jgi:DNA-binding transcriptional LysR family regulator
VVDRQDLCVALPDGHALAAHAEIAPDMLVDEPLVATSLEMEMAFGRKASAVAPARSSMRVVTRVADPFSTLTLVAAGVGLGIVSASLRRMAIPGVVFRVIAGSAGSSVHAAAYRKNEGAPVIKAFISFLRTRMSNA